MTPTRTTDYTNEAQQRLVKLILLMFTDVVNGLAPSVLAREIGCSKPVMTRDLDNLLTAGIAERDENTGLFRLTPRLPQQAIKVLVSIDAAERRLQEAKNRFTRIIPEGQSPIEMANRFVKKQD